VGRQTCHDGIAGGNAAAVTFGLEGMLEVEVAIGMVGDQRTGCLSKPWRRRDRCHW
jgi:hypothetical protein